MGVFEYSGGCKCYKVLERKLEVFGYSDKFVIFWTCVFLFIKLEGKMFCRFFLIE